MVDESELEGTDYESIEEQGDDGVGESSATSWYTLNGQDYFLAPTTIPHVPSGLYNIIFSQDSGLGLSRVEYTVDDIFLLSGMPYTTIINDLAAFWNSADKFKLLKLKPHRGILLHGEIGCGKSSLIYKIIEEIKVFDGVVVQFHDPVAWMSIIPILRRLESDRPIICVIKNLDKILERFGEDNFLHFLDSIHSIGNIIYIATTNNINAIPDRIQNSPSHFDRKYEITKPTDVARREYLKKKLEGVKQKKYKIEKLVEDTKGFTMAHLREFFVSVFVFNNDYNTIITTLRNIKSSTQNPKFFGRK